MATAKKTAAKKIAAKASTVPTAQLPAGYTPMSNIGQAWDYASNPLLEGFVKGSVRAMTVGKGRARRDTRIVTIMDDDGVLHDVWESTSLRPFFDNIDDGMRVAVAYQGEKDVNQPQPMKVFVGALADVQEKPARKTARKGSR